jgi:hypothetical protein
LFVFVISDMEPISCAGALFGRSDQARRSPRATAGSKSSR